MPPATAAPNDSTVDQDPPPDYAALVADRLTSEHLQHLRTSGLDAETIALARIYSLRSSAEIWRVLEWRGRWRSDRHDWGSGIAFPFVAHPGADEIRMVRVRPDQPRPDRGDASKTTKYEQPKGIGVMPYFAPRSTAGYSDASREIVFVEGEKKALLLDQLGYVVVGSTGVQCWHDVQSTNQWVLHPLLTKHLSITRRRCVICFDADVADPNKAQIMSAARTLAGMLIDAGAAEVRLAHPPASGPKSPKGIDDLYVAAGAAGEQTVRSLLAHASLIEPGPTEREGVRTRRDTRPEILITPAEDVVVSQAIAALARDPHIYRRGTLLVRIDDPEAHADHQHPEDGPPTIAPLPRAVLRTRLAAVARWLTPAASEGERPQPAHPPMWAVEAVRDMAEWPGVRRLAGLVETPVLRPDGTVLDDEGYDATTGLVLRPVVPPLPVPSEPTASDVRAALAALEDVVCDFPFEAPHHRSAWLASVLTLLGRHAVEGPCPMFLVDAPTAGSGKGLLADCAVCVGTGRKPPLDGYPDDDKEADKRLLVWAITGRRAVVFDNVSRRIGSDALCRALTAVQVSGRLLGLSAERAAPLQAVFFATANNAVIGADMHRRVCHVRIAPTTESPETRTGFRHPDLIHYVMANRAELARAALALLRAYCAAGRPHQHLPAWGSYEAWSALVRSAVVWVGRPDPYDGRDELRAMADDRAALHRALVKGWADLVARARGPVTARQAIERVYSGEPDSANPLPDLRAAIEELAQDRRGAISSSRLGYVLRSLRRRVFDGGAAGPTMLDCVPARGGVQAWTVVRVPGTTDAEDGGGGGTGPHDVRRRAPAGSRGGDGGDGGDDSSTSLAVDAPLPGGRCGRGCDGAVGEPSPPSPPSPPPAPSSSRPADPAADSLPPDSRPPDSLRGTPAWDRWRRRTDELLQYQDGADPLALAGRAALDAEGLPSAADDDGGTA